MSVLPKVSPRRVCISSVPVPLRFCFLLCGYLYCPTRDYFLHVTKQTIFVYTPLFAIICRWLTVDYLWKSVDELVWVFILDVLNVEESGSLTLKSWSKFLCLYLRLFVNRFSRCLCYQPTLLIHTYIVVFIPQNIVPFFKWNIKVPFSFCSSGVMLHYIKNVYFRKYLCFCYSFLHRRRFTFYSLRTKENEWTKELRSHLYKKKTFFY